MPALATQIREYLIDARVRASHQTPHYSARIDGVWCAVGCIVAHDSGSSRRYCFFVDGVCQEDFGATNPLRSDRTGAAVVAARCAQTENDPIRCSATGACDFVQAPAPDGSILESCNARGFYLNMLASSVASYDTYMQSQITGGLPPPPHPVPQGGGPPPGSGLPPVPPVQGFIPPPDHGGGSAFQCEAGWELVSDINGCRECPFPDRCNGTSCVEGSGGAGCAYCNNGANGTQQYYQSGAECKPCSASVLGNIIALVIGVAAGTALCWYVWQLTTVTVQDDAASTAEEGTAATAKIEQLEEMKGNAETIAELRGAVAAMSSTAIVSGIAFPSLFKISITFSLPFGMPKFLGAIGAWIAQIVSIDMQFGNPECEMEVPDPLSVFKLKFFFTHVVFVLFLVALSVPAVFGEQHRLHATNARIAVYTMAVGALVKSCVSSIACQEEVLGGTSGPYVDDGSARVVMIAMPDEVCWTSDHSILAFFAVLMLVVYTIVVPAVLFCKAKNAAADGDWSSDELQQYGWLVLKYKPSRWYFEFVVLFDKIVFVLLTVFFASERSVALLLGFSILATLVMLVFVVYDKPYREEAEGTEGMGKEDKIMALSLVLQFISFVIAWVCHSDTVARKDYIPDLENGEEPLEGLSPGVEFAASAAGLLIVVVQIATIWWAGQGAEEETSAEVEETATEAIETDAEAAARTESPLNNAE